MSLFVCLATLVAFVAMAAKARADVAASPAVPPNPPIDVGVEGQWQWKGGKPPEARYSLLQRQLMLSTQINDLQRERAEYGIAGPIVMMAAGGGVVLGSVYAYAIYELSHAFDYCDSSSSNCNESDHTQANYVFTAIGIGGVVLAVAGLVIFNNRLAPRRQLGHEINAKKAELKSIDQRLRFSTMLGPNNLRGASLALSF